MQPVPKPLSGSTAASAFYDTAKLKRARKVIVGSNNRTAHLLVVGLIGCNGCIIALTAFKPCRWIVMQTGLCFFSQGSLCAGIVVSEVAIETAPIRDDLSAVRVTGTNPLRAAASHPMQAHTCNLLFLVIQIPLRIRLCSAAPHSRIPGLVSDLQESAQKPSLPWVALLNRTQTHTRLPDPQSSRFRTTLSCCSYSPSC